MAVRVHVLSIDGGGIRVMGNNVAHDVPVTVC